MKFTVLTILLCCAVASSPVSLLSNCRPVPLQNFPPPPKCCTCQEATPPLPTAPGNHPPHSPSLRFDTPGPHASGTLWHLSFWDWRVTFSITLSRFAHILVCIRIPSFVRLNISFYLCNTLFIHSFAKWKKKKKCIHSSCVWTLPSTGVSAGVGWVMLRSPPTAESWLLPRLGLIPQSPSWPGGLWD